MGGLNQLRKQHSTSQNRLSRLNNDTPPLPLFPFSHVSSPRCSDCVKQPTWPPTVVRFSLHLGLPFVFVPTNTIISVHPVQGCISSLLTTHMCTTHAYKPALLLVEKGTAQKFHKPALLRAPVYSQCSTSLILSVSLNLCYAVCGASIFSLARTAQRELAVIYSEYGGGNLTSGLFPYHFAGNH
jgi:hypothetical protein